MRRAAGALALGVCTTVLAASCAWPGSATQEARSGCATAPAAPHTVAAVIEALERHGFSATVDCDWSSADVTFIGNGDASHQEGHVVCTARGRFEVFDGAKYLRATVVDRIPGRTMIIVGNVGCGFYPRAEARPDGAARLLAALRELTV
jgi:hypothetical protein